MCKGVGLGDILNILRDCLASLGVPRMGLAFIVFGGEGGIRTPGTLTSSAV